MYQYKLRVNIVSFFAIFLPIFFIFILPFSMQYNDKYGSYNFTLGLSGVHLWEGMGEYPNKYGFVCNDSVALERAYQLGLPKGAPFGTPEFSRLLREEAMSVIKQDPMFYIGTVLKRHVRYFFTLPILGVTEKTLIYFRDFEGGYIEFLRCHPVIFFENVIKKILAFSIPILSILSFFIFKQYRKELFLLVAIWQFRILLQVHSHLEDRYVLEAYFPLIIIVGLYAASYKQILLVLKQKLFKVSDSK
jgi:hypothetical protein